MRKITIVVILALLSLLVSCEKDTIGIGSVENADVQLNIQLDVFNKAGNVHAFPAGITAVRVTVTGPNMSQVQKNLTISGTTASGTLTIPKGSSRKFVVEGLDGSNVIFRGETTTDITQNSQTVTMTANWLTSTLNLVANIAPIPYNYNRVVARITGMGISGTRIEILNINATGAQKSFTIARGDKNIVIDAFVTDGVDEFRIYSGSKDVSVLQQSETVQVNLTEITANQDVMALHDGSFEETRYSSVSGDIVAAGFDLTSFDPVFIKKISYNLAWAGNDGDYRIILLDGLDLSFDIRFRTAPLAAGNDGDITWNLWWDPAVDGIFDGVLIAGLEYASNNAWPDISYDTSAPSGSSLFYDSVTQSWNFMADGDFAITLVVETLGGTVYKLKPVRIFPDLTPATLPSGR